MIFYFTGTGNSLYIAQKLADKFDTRLVSIKEATHSSNYNFQLEKNEILGIVVPVYYMGLPNIVNNFLKNLTLSGNPKTTFAIVTFGGMAGNAVDNIENLLFNKNIKTNYKLDLRMPENYVVYYNPPSKVGQEEIFQNAEIELSSFIKALSEENPSFYNNNKNLITKIASKIFYSLYNLSTKTQKFYSTEKCIGCKICAQICPSKAIVMENNRPRWIKNTCEKCSACINRCPHGAVEYGKSTIKRNRYVNPLVKF